MFQMAMRTDPIRLNKRPALDQEDTLISLKEVEFPLDTSVVKGIKDSDDGLSLH